jgi:hypothetical protein
MYSTNTRIAVQGGNNLEYTLRHIVYVHVHVTMLHMYMYVGFMEFVLGIAVGIVLFTQVNKELCLLFYVAGLQHSRSAHICICIIHVYNYKTSSVVWLDPAH